MNFDNPEINKYKNKIYNCNIDELSSHIIAEYTVDLDMLLEFQLNFDNEEIYFTLTGENIEIYYGNNKKEIYDKIKEIKLIHKYGKEGTFIVRIQGNLKKFSRCSRNIIKVINCNYYLEDLDYAFDCCKKLREVPNYIPNNIQKTRGMFYKCEKFNSDISRWNVSNVKDMYEMFYACYSFNSDISEWNVSNVTNMSLMFSYCEKFNSNISKWNVSNVQNTPYFMFDVCCILKKYKPKFKN